MSLQVFSHQERADYMNRTHSLHHLAAETGRSLAVDAARAKRATTRSGEQALRRLSPRVEAAAADWSSAARHVTDRARRPRRRMPWHGTLTAAPARASRLRAVVIACAGLLGLTALAWRWRVAGGAERWFPTPVDRSEAAQQPSEAVAAVSARGIAAAEAVEESTLTTGTTGAE
ncbi:hypothetical protein [Kitasatospora sp. NBC_01302]|uniref:hypothetical protein n=1 Tax=Kitasatospora sp. NBC_01302 TaxID=2903575 RepID=UPI002E137856|nr:hypothetical protein OG294_00755 [Kitasatospora sp. NBC_01302]